VHDDRAIVVVVGVTTYLRSAGKRHTGRRVAGGTVLHPIELNGREMRKTFLTLNVGRCFRLLSRIPGNSSVRFGKGELETWLVTRVWERGLSVSITLASPSGNEVTRQLPIS
jgi:hypothetical protein